MNTLRKNSYVFLFVFMSLFFTSQALCITSEEFMGEYDLDGFKLTMKNSPYLVVTDDECRSVSGRLSVTTQGFVCEIGGYYTNAVYQIYSLNLDSYECGFYTLHSSGNYIDVNIKAGTYTRVNIRRANGILYASWTESIFAYGDFYSIYVEASFVKKQEYYTRNQMDIAVASSVTNATQNLYTKAQVAQAVQNATAGMYSTREFDEAVDLAIANATSGMIADGVYQKLLCDAMNGTGTKKGDVAPLVLDPNGSGMYISKGDGRITIGDAVMLLKACCGDVRWAGMITE